MDTDALRALLDDVASGRVSPAAASHRLERLPFADLGYARVDHHRPLRQGIPEAVYGPGKTPDACAGIVAELLANGTGPVILTRAATEQIAAAIAVNPGGAVTGATVVWRRRRSERKERVTVVTAGTADAPVADECHAVLTAHGFCPRRLTDVGVAGLHRLLPHLDELAGADVVVVVAGMEGALVSVIGGLTPAPVIAVPTSVGYGASLEGVTALLGMLASCSPGVTVVGIDNGFGAACAVVPRVPAASGTTVTTTAWFGCSAGVAGDMLLGSLIDAGADEAAVREIVAGLRVAGWRLDVEATQRCGVRASHAVVTTDERPQHRPYAAIRSLLDGATLPDRVRQRAAATFQALAEVEGAIHGCPPDEVEFHEVGALDAIVDVVGTCAALEVLGVERIGCSPLSVGHGTVRSAHGVLPNPAPAVVALAARAGAPLVGVDVAVELTTPTGAALVTTLADRFGPLAAMRPSAVGYGAGRRDLDGRPNVVQVVVGAAEDTSPVGTEPGQPLALVEVNVDDATGETLAVAITALLDAGAHDAWVTPIVMKKGRPAHTVSALCDPAVVGPVAATLSTATGSLGVRAGRLERWPRSRVEGWVLVDGETVRVKVGAGRIKAEHDDVAAAARRLDRPVHEIAARAEAAWRAGEER